MDSPSPVPKAERKKKGWIHKDGPKMKVGPESKRVRRAERMYDD